MVELQPIYTPTRTLKLQSNSNNSSSSNSPTNSTASPNHPSPTSLLSPHTPLMHLPLPHRLYPASPSNPPPNFQIIHHPIYLPLPQQPYYTEYPPYYDYNVYYPNPPNCFPHPNYPDNHFYPQPAAAAAGPHHGAPVGYPDYQFYPQAAAPASGPHPGAPVAFSAGVDGGAPDGGDPRRCDIRRRIRTSAKRFSGGGGGGRGPRNYHGQRSFERCTTVKKVWKPKESSSLSPPPPPPPPQSPSPRWVLGKNCTTIMIKNIPNDISRSTLIDMVESHCREQNEIAEQKSDPRRSRFDFLYLPFDFKWRKNLGYAFVNFTTVEGASRLDSCWSKKGWEGSHKIREITPAILQGRERCKKHFRISEFYCHSEEYLPVLFSPARDGSNGGASRMTTIGRWVCR